jgi:hypothetical protein
LVGLGQELDAIIAKQPIIRLPRFRHRQWLVLHGRGSGEQPQKAHLRDPGEGNEVGLIGLPPRPGVPVMNVILDQQGKPDVDIRETR